MLRFPGKECAMGYISLTILALCLFHNSHARGDHAIGWRPTWMTVSEFRITINEREGDRITVMGVLYPYMDKNNKLDDVSLVPGKAYLDFDPSIVQAYSINLENFASGSSKGNILEECLKRWVTVTGKAKLVRGVPGIVDIISIRSSDAVVSCHPK